MKKIEVTPSLCPQNHPCPIVRVCPTGAISQKNAYSAPIIEDKKCIKCGKCLRFCAFGAFQENNNN